MIIKVAISVINFDKLIYSYDDFYTVFKKQPPLLPGRWVRSLKIFHIKWIFRKETQKCIKFTISISASSVETKIRWDGKWKHHFKPHTSGTYVPKIIKIDSVWPSNSRHRSGGRGGYFFKHSMFGHHFLGCMVEFFPRHFPLFKQLLLPRGAVASLVSVCCTEGASLSGTIFAWKTCPATGKSCWSDTLNCYTGSPSASAAIEKSGINTMSFELMVL